MRIVKASWTQITAGFQSEWCSRGSGLRATTCTTRGLPVASESSVFPNGDQGCAKIIRVILRGFGGLDAGWAGEEVLFERGRLGFVRDHAEVVAFEVVIGDVVNEVHWLLN